MSLIKCKPDTLAALRVKAILCGTRRVWRLEVRHEDYGHVADVYSASGKVSFRPLVWNSCWSAVIKDAGLRADVQLPASKPFLDVLRTIAARVDDVETYVASRARASRSDP